MNYIYNLTAATKLVAASILLLSSVLTTSAFAAQQEHAELIKRFEQKLNFKIISVADANVPGLLQINTDTGIFYASENGEYFLSARIYRVGDEIVDETGAALQKYRLEGIKRFKDSAIEFKSAKEKYVLNVFTDATCGYCRKLHNEMDILNDLGITVRYLAFPRQGLNSKVYSDAVSIWCSDNPQEAMTQAKAGGNVASTSCENEVAEQYNFGKAIGVNGTPNIILPDGTVIPGYQPAQALLAALRAAEKA
ncbi:thioredoxin fold domain-containing protein [Brumicola nitratireducens]|uniref:Thiol:disulfide interchange protein n=1 Tax=Glaciecola nitratireducens (strain JCM 12485 / KCTC 12276 / FR1064) TaxID=1085623 RepID=G4QFR2_GLANF|nr:thioredoxin fold domain-containing protein [Glaciecola nitratireducens]AEP28847.1 thiol:disulfide interchange protein DsbC [Glaciecola nitratireducens FR1064]